LTNNRTRFLLAHPSGLDIHPGMTEENVFAIPDVRRRDMRTGYVWFSLPEGLLAGERVAIALCFANGHLDCLTVAVCDEVHFGASWSDWTESNELARTEATRRWFANVGYPVGTYSWGHVYAEFDPRSGSGGGGVRFQRRA